MRWWLFAIAALVLGAIVGACLPDLRALFYVGKPLATLAIVLLALRLPTADARYRRGIVIGLLFGLLGDVLLMLRGERAFMAGLVSFLLGHVAYLLTYRLRAPLFAAAWPFLSYALLAVIVLAWLWPHLPNGLPAPVIVYVTLLAGMAAQAAAMWWRCCDAPSACAAIGGACFLASDAILAINRFTVSFTAAQVILLALYWLAQVLIALSIHRTQGVA